MDSKYYNEMLRKLACCNRIRFLTECRIQNARNFLRLTSGPLVGCFMKVELFDIDDFDLITDNSEIAAN